MLVFQRETIKGHVFYVLRPQFDALMSFVQTADSLVIHRMDRLARNLDDLRFIVQNLTQRNVRIEFVKEDLTFSGEDSSYCHPNALCYGIIC